MLVFISSIYHTSIHIEFKNLCNASKHMNMHMTNAINQSSWACSPYLCASLVQEFWSFSIPQCCSLFVHIHVQIQLFPNASCIFHIFIPISPPLSSISIKGVHLLIQMVALGIDGWGLNLAFFWTFPNVGVTPLVSLEIPHVGSLTLIPIVVGLLPVCPNMSHTTW